MHHIIWRAVHHATCTWQFTSAICTSCTTDRLCTCQWICIQLQCVYTALQLPLSSASHASLLMSMLHHAASTQRHQGSQLYSFSCQLMSVRSVLQQVRKCSLFQPVHANRTVQRNFSLAVCTHAACAIHSCSAAGDACCAGALLYAVLSLAQQPAGNVPDWACMWCFHLLAAVWC